MASSPTKRTRATATDDATPSQTTRSSRAEIIMVGSSTPTRRGRGRGRGGATPGSRTPRATRTLATPTASPSKSPSKSAKGKEKEVEPTTPSKSPSKSKRGGAANIASTSHISRRPAVSASEEDDEEGDDSSQGSAANDDDEMDLDEAGEDGSPSKPFQARLDLPELAGNETVRRTASDVYFHLTSKPSKTSSNVFSSLLPQLSPEECTSPLDSSPANMSKKHPGLLESLRGKNEVQFPTWAFQLSQGFNLMLYGYGSKLGLMNRFATTICAKKGHVVIANGFWTPGITIRHILDAVEQQIPDILTHGGSDVKNAPSRPTGTSASGIELQARRIYDYFSSFSSSKPHAPRLFLIIHNIDYATHLRLPRARTILALLASHPRIHLVASMDNVHSGIMWSSNEILGRGHDPIDRSDRDAEGSEEDEGEENEDGARTRDDPVKGAPSSRAFTFLYVETPTFDPYTIELSFRDTSVLPRSRGAASAFADLPAGGADGAKLINETAARQVLASVTQKAKRLFDLLGRAQLSAYESVEAEAGKDGADAAVNGRELGMSYDILGMRAREEFLATSDGALRALLTEFRDHGLVVQSAAGASDGTEAGGKVSGDVLWIPLSKDVLLRILDSLTL